MLERDADTELKLVWDKIFSENIVQQTILLDRALELTLPDSGAVYVSRLAAAKPKPDIRHDRRSVYGIPAGKCRRLTEYIIRRTR